MEQPRPTSPLVDVVGPMLPEAPGVVVDPDPALPPTFRSEQQGARCHPGGLLDQKSAGAGHSLPVLLNDLPPGTQLVVVSLGTICTVGTRDGLSRLWPQTSSGASELTAMAQGLQQVVASSTQRWHVLWKLAPGDLPAGMSLETLQAPGMTIVPWLPQNKVLAGGLHPVAVFVTHGGINSLYEVTYFVAFHL